MSLKYHSGDEIRKGDRVLLSRESGVIKFVADPSLDNPDTQWYVNEFGGGVMVAHERLGPVFIDDPESDGDLELVDRADAGN